LIAPMALFDVFRRNIWLTIRRLEGSAYLRWLFSHPRETEAACRSTFRD